MNHMKALIVKGIMTIGVLSLVLSLSYGVPFLRVLVLSLVLGAVSYAAGDLTILPRTNNLTATIADFVLTFIIVFASSAWIFSLDGSAFLASLISAGIMAVGEYGFHIFLASHILPSNARLRTDEYY
ncbi:DUF2512 family protein [Halobacillus sp. B23F22_1]|uniref:DUF2512 family protein n=1 Tax=Halobacillus sp. B23F22_1 TaxID=3459514 RepID=UPI00373F5676